MGIIFLLVFIAFLISAIVSNHNFTKRKLAFIGLSTSFALTIIPWHCLWNFSEISIRRRCFRRWLFNALCTLYSHIVMVDIGCHCTEMSLPRIMLRIRHHNVRLFCIQLFFSRILRQNSVVVNG